MKKMFGVKDNIENDMCVDGCSIKWLRKRIAVL